MAPHANIFIIHKINEAEDAMNGKNVANEILIAKTKLQIALNYLDKITADIKVHYH